MMSDKPHCFTTLKVAPLSIDEVVLNFTLKNTTDKKIKLLIWYTPFEGCLSDLFVITNSDTGEQLNYQGPMVKRLKPQADDYLTLAANEVSSTKLNLSLAYVFTAGNYQIKLKNQTLYYQNERQERVPLICPAAPIAFRIK